MSETFSAVSPKLFDKHVRRSIYASIQTPRNVLSDIERDSGTNRKKLENFKKIRNMRKKPRVNCFSTKMLKLQFMYPIKQFEAF